MIMLNSRWLQHIQSALRGLLIVVTLGGSLDAAAAANRVAKPKAATRPGPPPGTAWKLVWQDEFEGTSLDTNRWSSISPSPWSYPGFPTRASESNCFLDGDGHLVLRLTRDPDGTVRYHRGLYSGNFQQAYGYFETRAQFSRQPGWWTAVWLSGVPYDEGTDPFVMPQEFDLFEDFYKPKTRNDISHCYHVTAKLSPVVDQGDGKGIGGSSMAARTTIGRVSKGKVVELEEYGGWHTVGLEWTPLEHVFYVDGQETLRQTYREVPITTVPQRVRISSCLRTPKELKKDGAKKAFYGWLEEAAFPDQLAVDYVRVYQQDTGGRTAPSVTVALQSNPAELHLGQPATFVVRAEDRDGTVKTVCLFSKGYIRAEAEADTAGLTCPFTVTNLFEGDNAMIAMARDDHGLVGMSAPLRLHVNAKPR